MEHACGFLLKNLPEILISGVDNSSPSHADNYRNNLFSAR